MLNCDEFHNYVSYSQRFNVFGNTSIHSSYIIYMPDSRSRSCTAAAGSTFACAMDMFLCRPPGNMWKKGSYDVSGKHDSNRLSVVVLSHHHHGETLINVEKSGPWKRLKWFPELRENLLIQLVVALFLVIFVLIGVIIWLSVSIHLSNRDSLRTISTAVDLILTGQNVNTKPCSTDAPQTGQSGAISPCDTLFRAAFELTEPLRVTVDEEIRDSGIKSSSSQPTGTTTIRSTARESFSLKGTSYQIKGSSCNNCQITILQKSPINKTGESNAEDDSEEEISDEIDDDDDVAKAVETN